MSDRPDSVPPATEPAAHGWLWAAAVAFHLVIGVIPYLGSPLVAPPGGVAVLWGLWVLGAVVIWRLRVTPRLAIWVPLVALLAWVAVVTVGDVALGWTAAGLAP